MDSVPDDGIDLGFALQFMRLPAGRRFFEALRNNDNASAAKEAVAKEMLRRPWHRSGFSFCLLFPPWITSSGVPNHRRTYRRSSGIVYLVHNLRNPFPPLCWAHGEAAFLMAIPVYRPLAGIRPALGIGKRPQDGNPDLIVDKLLTGGFQTS